MLELLYGRTRRLWQPVTERVQKAREENRPVILLVPEQYTLQAERDLIRDLHLPGLLDISVLSPSRLAQRVFDLAGANEQIRLDARGRRIAVARALAQKQEKLTYYRRAAEQPGFISAVAELLASLREEKADSEALAAASDKVEDAVVRQKMQDMALVMAAYEEVMGDRFADSVHVRSDMLQRLPGSGLVRGAVVCAYGFDVLTPPLRDILAALAACAHSVLVTLVGDREQALDGAAFAPVLKSAQRLTAFLNERNIPYTFTFLPPTPIDAPAAIQHVEQYFLSYKRPPLNAPVPSVRLLSAPTPYAEADRAALEVRMLLDSGVAPDSILVMCGSLSRYGSLLSSRMAAYGVPCYVASKSPVITHGVVRCLLSALRCIAKGWQVDDAEEMISSGFSSLTKEEGWQLRNYMKAAGIRGNLWKKPFTRGTGEEKALVEPLRQTLVTPVLRMHEGLLQADTAAQSLEAVLLYLEDIGAYQRMAALETELMAQGLVAEAAKARQVWKKLIETFEQMHLLLAEERIPLTRFAAWLAAALQETEVSALPPDTGSVQVGEIGRLLAQEPDVVLLLGLNDGLMAGSEDVLFSDREKEVAEEGLDIYLGLTARDKERVRLLDLWKAMVSPRKQLLLFYALSEEDGGVLRPLSQLETLRQLLPMLVEEGGAFLEQQQGEPLAPGPALAQLATLVWEETLPPAWADALNWLRQDADWADRTDSLLAAAGGDVPPARLTAAQAHRLFRTDSVSVSRLETFANCPFKHFVQHGLNPLEQKEWKVERKDAGTFYHSALERFAKAAATHPTWPDIPREECDGLTDEAIKPLTDAWADSAYADSPRAQFISRRYVDSCRRVAWTLTQGMQHSAFRIQGVEISFGEGEGLPPLVLDLPDGSQVLVRGKIDRVDGCEVEGQTYLRVVDYKSGSAWLNPTDIYAGIQLQLLIYLKALLTSHDALPAGVFYQKVDNPLLKGEKIENPSMEQAERKITEALRLNGLAISDVEVIRLMDKAEPSLSLPTLLKKDGDFRSDAKVASEEEWQALLDFAVQKATDIVSAIRSGEAMAAPAVYENNSPCTYCEYAGICRRDPMMSGKNDRPKRKMKLEELLQEVTGAAQGKTE